MREQTIEIRTRDGAADAVLFSADDGRPQPGAIHLTDIGGIRPSHLGMARRLAEQGYSVLVPNVFYRNGRAPLFELPIDLTAEPTRKRFAEFRAPLTPAAVVSDVSAYVDALVAQPSVGAGPIGVVGYCFCGAIAMRMAAERPDRVAAAASFHGGGLCTDDPSSPHLLLPRIKAELYFGHAVQDRSMPADSIERFERALADWGGRYTSETYARALHGWTVPDHAGAYDPTQAERAFATLAALFARTLRSAWPAGAPVVGQRAERSRAVTARDIERFTDISGDRNPLHYDPERAARTKMGGIVVQGGVTSAILNAVVAEDLPGPGTVFLNVNWNFKAPVRPGDTITGQVEITKVRHDKPITELVTRVVRGDGTVALEGTAVCYTFALVG